MENKKSLNETIGQINSTINKIERCSGNLEFNVLRAEFYRLYQAAVSQILERNNPEKLLDLNQYVEKYIEIRNRFYLTRTDYL